MSRDVHEHRAPLAGVPGLRPPEVEEAGERQQRAERARGDDRLAVRRRRARALPAAQQRQQHDRRGRRARERHLAARPAASAATIAHAVSASGDGGQQPEQRRPARRPALARREQHQRERQHQVDEGVRTLAARSSGDRARDGAGTSAGLRLQSCSSVTEKTRSPPRADSRIQRPCPPRPSAARPRRPAGATGRATHSSRKLLPSSDTETT